MSDSLPMGFFITFRSYGTWLHGDERGAVDRFHNQYGSPRMPADEDWLRHNQRRLNQTAVTLSPDQRESVDRAIRETCSLRKWTLRAVNARTNHVHVVVSDADRPDHALNAFKANATRQLRLDGVWPHAHSPWSDGGSKLYLWTEVGLERVIEYVLNGQDGPLPKLD